MYRDRPKSPSITQSTEDTNTLRAAMSLYVKRNKVAIKDCNNQAVVEF